MKITKKILSSVLICCSLLALSPTDLFHKTVKADENIPKYLNYNYGETGEEVYVYKDKVIARIFDQDGSNNYYFNKGVITKIDSNIGIRLNYKEFESSIDDGNGNRENRVFDMEQGNLTKTLNIHEKEQLVSNQYGNKYNFMVPSCEPSKNYGSWYHYMAFGSNVFINGVITPDDKVVQIDGDMGLSYEATYGDNFYTVVFDRDNYDHSFLEVVNKDGNLKKYEFDNNIRENYTPLNVVVSDNQIYINLVNKNDKSDNKYYKININGNILSKGEVLFNTSDLRFYQDFYGNFWSLSDGFVYKFENNKWVKKYQVDPGMDYMVIYDDDNMVLLGSEKQTDKPIYTIINNGQNQGKNGWTQENGKWKYYDNGKQAAGWKAVANKWYHFNANSEMETGWIKDGNKWYYMSPSGDMQVGWVKHGNTWYYMNSDGAMQTGWVKSGNKWYFMGDAGDMKTGWIKLGSSWYYLYNDGSMATGWIKVNNVSYYLNSNGVWVK